MTIIGSDISTIKKASLSLAQDQLVVFPTETVYGLGANAYSDKAMQKVFDIKKRPSTNPIIVHVASLDHILLAAQEISPLEQDLFKAFSPGPMTLVLPKNKLISSLATGGLDTVGVRIPNHPIALALLENTPVPVAAPSANMSGKPSPTTIEMCRYYMEGCVPYILDGGSLSIGLESTVLKVEKEKIYILRSGALSAKDIYSAVGIKPEQNIEQSHRSPGTHFAHYQPKAHVILFQGELPAVSDKAAILTFQNTNDWKHSFIFSSPEEYAQALYRIFFWCDSQKIETIYCEIPSSDGIGHALIDRLTRASGYRNLE
ncbi:MAG: L-threonylcarbamoyladenylate synthase [Brevinema sp.]